MFNSFIVPNASCNKRTRRNVELTYIALKTQKRIDQFKHNKLVLYGNSITQFSFLISCFYFNNLLFNFELLFVQSFKKIQIFVICRCLILVLFPAFELTFSAKYEMFFQRPENWLTKNILLFQFKLNNILREIYRLQPEYSSYQFIFENKTQNYSVSEL